MPTLVLTLHPPLAHQIPNPTSSSLSHRSLWQLENHTRDRVGDAAWRDESLVVGLVAGHAQLRCAGSERGYSQKAVGTALNCCYFIGRLRMRWKCSRYSCTMRSLHKSLLAQLVERVTSNDEVSRSSRLEGTSFFATFSLALSTLDPHKRQCSCTIFGPRINECFMLYPLNHTHAGCWYNKTSG